MDNEEIDIDLEEIVLPTFDEIVDDVLEFNVDRLILKGGRNSTKSSVIALSILLGVLTNRVSAVCMVKYDNKVYERLVSAFLEMAGRAGIEDLFKYKIQKKELVLLDGINGKETNIKIKFTGVDDPSKLKSFKSDDGTGGFGYIWFEEATDFNNIAEIDNVINTMGRGEGKRLVILTYNPPKSTSNWVNIEYNVPCGEVLGFSSNSYTTSFELEVGEYKKTIVQKVHHSTYLDVLNGGHPEWLGMTLGLAEQKREKNNVEYRWEYLGEAIGTEGNVFTNIHDLTMEHYERIDKSIVYRGLDFGFTKDPTSYLEVVYNNSDNELYIINEFYLKGASTDTIASNIRLYNKHNFTVWCDSAEPRTINELQLKGTKAVGVTKGPDSVRHGVKWLQGLNAIYISPIRTPNTYKEFTRYEYKINRLGEYTSELGDNDNHSIDACRYACNIIIR